MQDDIASLYEYNRWADRRVLDACRGLTPEQYAAEPVPGWPSVRSSVIHIAIATDGWLRGVAGEDVQTVPGESDLETVDAAAALLERAHERIQSLLPGLTPESLATVREFRGRGKVAALPPWAVLRHIVNHSTYHRGQIASKLGRLGVAPPITDFIYWVLERGHEGG